MKKGVHRQGGTCTGHGCWPPRSNTSWSNNVICNDLGVHREGDGWSLHCCGLDCHTSVLDQGSSTVFANDQGVARITDPVACGSFAHTGSGNVFCGD